MMIPRGRSVLLYLIGLPFSRHPSVFHLLRLVELGFGKAPIRHSTTRIGRKKRGKQLKRQEGDIGNEGTSSLFIIIIQPSIIHRLLELI